MCGIYGVIGENSTSEVMAGIKRLEYRGYDSAGIAFLRPSFMKSPKKMQIAGKITIFSSGMITIKEEGQLEKLEKIYRVCAPRANIAIGHTRWATHGRPSPENSHPHVSQNGQWAIVHNGIIENYLELKTLLKGMTFKSETDSEVIANLLEHFYNGNPLETLHYVCSIIKGSYALAVIFSEMPDKIFVAKNNSPVVVGASDEKGVVCSDLNSMVGVEEGCILENNNFAVVEKGNVCIFDENLNEINPKSVKIPQKSKENGLGKYKHHMLKEIDEVPVAIEKTVTSYDSFEKISKALPKSLAKSIDNILIIGCGTAYHAGLVGKKLFESVGIRSNCEIASEFRYGDFLYPSSSLAIFVSQSGETADTLKALEMCKERGLKTLSITNVRNSSICFASDYLIYTNAGAEIGVASTKAYDAQVAVFYLLSAYFVQIKFENEKENQKLLRAILNDENINSNNYIDFVEKEAKNLILLAEEIRKNQIKPLCRRVAKEIVGAKSIYMIGRGLDYATAQEASLKLKEISYITSEAYPAGELKHGTISLIDESKFVFAFACSSKTKDKTLSNVSEVISRGGKVILLSQFKIAKKGVHRVVKLPSFDEKYMPLIAVTYMQLIAYYTSVALGNNPDKPRSLAKSVTVE